MKKLFILVSVALGVLACSGKNDPTNPDKPSGATIEGELTGAFSVSASKKVHFSQGNLQYQASTETWKFARDQNHYVGSSAEPSSTYAGWIDLYCWGASGYNDRYPYINLDEYYRDIEDALQTDICGTNYDWGVYNKISNGGNEAGLWRTLTDEEWQYIFLKRKDAEYLFGLGRVNGVNGLIILPDDWNTPTGLTFTPSVTKGWVWKDTRKRYSNGAKYIIMEGDFRYGYYNNNSDANNYNDNIYTSTEWSLMEKAGAVFLPSSIDGDTYRFPEAIGIFGQYWSSTFFMVYRGDPNGSCGCYLSFSENSICFTSGGIVLDQGMTGAVRLVRDVE